MTVSYQAIPVCRDGFFRLLVQLPVTDIGNSILYLNNTLL